MRFYTFKGRDDGNAIRVRLASIVSYHKHGSGYTELSLSNGKSVVVCETTHALDELVRE